METVIKERVILEGGGGEISGKGAATSQKKGASTVDDIVLFIAKMTSGALATFEASRLSTGYKIQIVWRSMVKMERFDSILSV